MDENLDINKLLETCIILAEYGREKTISSRTIQAAFRILYMNDNEKMKTGIAIATKYIMKSLDNIKINTFNHYNEILRNFLKNDAVELTPVNYRLGGNSVVYVCGIADYLNNRVQQFN
jgi:hypothetical protein